MTRQMKSKPGMKRQDALLSLQRSARTTGEEIVDFFPHAGRWVAELQKIAEFPPSDDESTEEPKEEPEAKPEGPPSDSEEGDDGASADSSDGEDKFPGAEKSKAQGPEGEKGEEKGELRELLSLIHQIADKMGIVPGGGHDEGMVPGGPGPAGPPPPVPGGDPGLGSAGKEEGHLPSKLHPGEVLPHQTPIGTPAFASTHTANPMAPPVAPGAGPAGAAQMSPPCSKCGGPTMGGQCPNCASAAGAIQASVIDPNGVVGKKRTIEAKVDVPMPADEAMRQATAAFQPHGYSVKQLVPQADGTWLAILEG